MLILKLDQVIKILDTRCMILQGSGIHPKFCMVIGHISLGQYHLVNKKANKANKHHHLNTGVYFDTTLLYLELPHSVILFNHQDLELGCQMKMRRFQICLDLMRHHQQHNVQFCQCVNQSHSYSLDISYLSFHL